MANQNKLKAYVRYDGTGRVIAGGPILQRFKPAVGNWVEINANECCNGTPTTTTTTTQGGVTPTAHIINLGYTEFGACENPYSTGVYYTNSSVITTGTIIYSDASLTTVASFNATYISINNILYTVSNAVVTSNGTPCGSTTTTTTTTTIATINVGTTSESCGTPSTFATVSFATGSNICDLVVELQGDFSMFPSTFYVIYGGFSRLFSKISDSIIQGAGGAPGECVSCG
jgi:hypothetical protein